MECQSGRAADGQLAANDLQVRQAASAAICEQALILLELLPLQYHQACLEHLTHGLRQL